MRSLLKRGALAILGVALTLGYWTVRGWFTDDASASLSHIPDKVWEGGGGKVTIRVDTSDPGRVSVSFEANEEVGSEDHRYLETWERVGAGQHAFTVEVPANVSGTAEVSAEEPKVGSRVRIAVEVDGRTAAEDAQTLTKPLKPGYGFFAQVYLEDYATGTPGED